MESSTPKFEGYTLDTNGKLVLTEESKAASLAMYYSGRLAYGKEDTRFPIGRYTATGEVVPFQPWPSKLNTISGGQAGDGQ